MRVTPSLTLLLALSAVLGSPAALAQVGKVNGTTIPQARADILLRDATSQGRPDSPELRQSIKSRLVESEIIAQEAIKLGLHKSAAITAQIDLARQQVLIGAYINEIARRNPPTEDALKKAHERLKDHPAASEYKARHILVANEDDAKAIIVQIKGGADFGKIAAEKSRDEGSKGQGGELDWNPPRAFVQPFSDAMVKLKKGTMTETPVRSNFGWHVIRMDDIRPRNFESLRPELEQYVQRENVQKTVDELRSKAKIE